MEEEESKELLDECWEMIFDRLEHESDRESITLVCKRFLSITNTLRDSIKFSDCTPISTTSRLLQRFSNLKKIRFCNFSGDLNEAVVAIARSGLDLEELLDVSHDRRQPAFWLEELGSKMQNLKVLRFASGQGDADLVRVADSFPELEELQIGDCRSRGDYRTIVVTGEGIEYLSSKLKKLRKIDISEKQPKPHISDKSLVSLSKNCALLEQIKLRYCYSVTECGISFLINNSHHLNSLHLFAYIKIGSFGAKGCTNLLTNLRSLRLQWVDISDEFLISLVEARIPLTDLALSYCKNYTFTGFLRLLQYISQSLKSLKLGEVEFLTNEHIEYLSPFLQNLTSIKLIDCSNLSDSAFVMITQTCPRLYHFKMTNSSIRRENYKFDGLEKKNSAIKHLDLSSHQNLSHSVLKRLLTICPGVEKLKLRDCSFLQSDCLNVYDILECNRRLVKLDLSRSHHLKYSRKSMESSMLEELIAKNSWIGDDFLTKLGMISPRLIHLDLEGCRRVTDEGVREVVKLCKRLRYLSISSCKNVDFSIIAWIVINSPSLRKLVSPSNKYPNDEYQKLFLQRGCLVLKGLEYSYDSYVDHYAL
ncbi:F-box/LRR-repeat protein 4-like [Chenopodium quinoa]|nr:F-box/LRR-repeat protein 4-like [Chenopodium quinoa]